MALDPLQHIILHFQQKANSALHTRRFHLDFSFNAKNPANCLDGPKLRIKLGGMEA
jgi:hypothetical protein